MKTKLLSLLAAVALAGTAYYGTAYWFDGRFIETTDNAYVRGDIVAVAPKVAGHVIEVAVEDNQPVKAGDLLFRIDPEDYQARLAQSEAALDAAQAARDSLVEEKVLQRALVDEAEAALGAARAEATRAGRDRQRADNLVADGWTTEQRHDTVVATETRARASVAQVEAGLAAQRQRLVVLDAQAVRLDAAIAQAAAQVRLAGNALDDTIVRSPMTGIVGNRHVEAGHYAKPGAPLLAVVPQHDIWIVANFRETQLEHLAPGQIVSVRVDTFGGRTITGRIDSLAPASGAQFSLLPPDNATGNFVRVVQRIPVKIALEDDSGQIDGLRPGMSAHVRIDTRGAQAPTLASSLAAWLQRARAVFKADQTQIEKANRS